MQLTHLTTDITPTTAVSFSSLQALLSQSEDDFYGSLQRIWNNVMKPEDMGIIQPENDKLNFATFL